MGDTQALPSWYEICLKCPGVTGRRPNSKCLVCIPVSHILEAFWQIAVTSLALHTLPSMTLVAGNIILCCLPMLSPWSILGLGSSVSTVYPRLSPPCTQPHDASLSSSGPRGRSCVPGIRRPEPPIVHCSTEKSSHLSPKIMGVRTDPLQSLGRACVSPIKIKTFFFKR